MRVQHIANIFQEVSSLNALGQETKQVKLLERSKPDRMILGEIFQIRSIQQRCENMHLGWPTCTDVTWHELTWCSRTSGSPYCPGLAESVRCSSQRALRRRAFDRKRRDISSEAQSTIESPFTHSTIENKGPLGHPFDSFHRNRGRRDKRLCPLKLIDWLQVIYYFTIHAS